MPLNLVDIAIDPWRTLSPGLKGSLLFEGSAETIGWRQTNGCYRLLIGFRRRGASRATMLPTTSRVCEINLSG